ncbi:hypothetical protein EDD96_5121 [Streptomyces sp. Ag109_G2-6]|uniref:hypothetical protein n=1 Tax=Streptomyces sp. Ag109_G2-6 TaxID=2485154 RepID=UPI0009A48A88|nr:hypothetical protein [Streptomyces sp. Ag109_G2-6]RPF41324.1 hypothetical protein EDD96_5121 [Streptomyces sp. Ag109_G2-6]
MFVRRSAKPRGTAAGTLSLRDRAGGVGRAMRAGVFLVLALIALSLAVPSTARAEDFACSFTGDDSYSRDNPGASGEFLIPAVNQWESASKRAKNLNDTTGMVTGAVRMPEAPERYTFYELNGMRGMNWSMTFRGSGNASDANGTRGSGADHCSIMDMINNGVANMVFMGTKYLARSAISIKELASNPSPLSGLYTGRDNAVDTIKNHVFIPAVPVMITLTGFWVFAKWRKGEMREAWSGVGWASLTTIAVVALLTGGNYVNVINQADAGIAQANSLFSEAVLSGAAGKSQSPCDLEGTDNRGLRISSCSMYDTLVFRPWALGQFGEHGTNCIFKKSGGGRIEGGACIPASAGTTCNFGKGARCEDVRVKQAVSQSVTNKDAFPGGEGEEKKVSSKDKEVKEWMPIRQDMAGGPGKGYPDDFKDQRIYPVSFDEWAGKNSGARVGLAVYSVFAALIVGIMVIVLSALTLLWHAVTLIMIIMLPLIATLGIHPSQQKLLKGWLQTFIHSFVLRAGFGVILTVLLALYQMILPAKISIGMQLLMLLLVTVAVVMMLKKLLSGAYSPQIAGAQDALGVGDMANTVGGKLAQYAPGAAAGAAKTTGRVVGGTAKVGKKGTLAALRTYDNRKNDGRWQKEGKLSTSQPSKREQRKAEYQTAAVQKDQLAEQYAAVEAKQERQAAEAEQAQSSGRLVGGGTPSAYVHRPRPAPPLPAPASAPAVPAQQDPQTSRVRVNMPDNGPVRQQPRVPAPDPGPVRQQSPTPAPDPRTPPPPAPRDGDSGRVSGG